jgi:hypothetical protein
MANLNNVSYASLDLLIRRGVGSNADEVCQNLVGKVDPIDLGDTTHDEPTEWTQLHITAARVQHDPTSMHPYYVYVDGEEIGQK